MSTLRSALEEMPAIGNDQLSNRKLAAEIEELTHCRQLFDSLLAERIRAMSQRGGHGEFGYPSPTAYRRIGVEPRTGPSPTTRRRNILFWVDERARYAKPEYERRFLLDELPDGLLAPVRIRDRYLSDTRLRLRRIETMDGETVELKLGHKWRPDPDDPGVIFHTSVYLDENEYGLLSSLPGDDLVKVRHRVPGQPYWAVDRHESPNKGVVMLEINFADVEEAWGFDPPGFVSRDVTGEPRYTGIGMAGRIETQ